MKNIILVDRDLTFIDTFLELQYHIVVLIVDSDSMAADCKSKYKNHPQITHIMSMQELEYVDGTPYLDYNLLHNFIRAQYKIEFVAHRWLNDGMLSSNRFINALCFWNHNFDTFHIDLVLIGCIEHGITYDIPAYIAKHRDIPAFFIPPTLIYGISILHFNTNTYIPFVSGNLNEEQIQESLFYHFNPDDIVLPTANKTLWDKQKTFIRQMLLKIGGQVLVDFIICLLKRDFTIKQHPGYFPVSFWHRLLCLLYTKKLKKYYKKISQSPNYNEPFIFYAMHFEPEGGTSVCVPLQNQLTIIQMLHNALPSGWKLYIKEHPHQFMLNNPEMVYFLYNLKWWKSLAFYEEIHKLQHTKLIDFDTPSKELIQYAKALATINGTIHIESTFHNKPCIVFGGKNLILHKAKNIICVENFTHLKGQLELLEALSPLILAMRQYPPCIYSKFTPHITNPKQEQKILSAQYKRISYGKSILHLPHLQHCFVFACPPVYTKCNNRGEIYA
ncbi:hypothetical protein [uncultured Helicobacter sp.]|uniref:hypothetical protein n=2 Tax=uncultured Helicobacter sp. TaxID=175537 RepID=UPI00263B0BA0|nr:hypothetical protein [uncultured Helicobacter sp.]